MMQDPGQLQHLQKAWFTGAGNDELVRDGSDYSELKQAWFPRFDELLMESKRDVEGLFGKRKTVLKGSAFA